MNKLVATMLGLIMAPSSPLPSKRPPVLRAPIGTLEPRKWRKRCGARNARGPKPEWRRK